MPYSAEAFLGPRLFLRALLAWRWYVVLFMTAAVAGAATVVFGAQEVWKASAKFIPTDLQNVGPPPRLRGLSQLIGFNWTTELGVPAVYVSLTKSRAVLRDILGQTFTTTTDLRPRTLFEIMGFPADPDASGEAQAVARLDKALSVDMTAATSVVTVTVGMSDPKLAADVANAVVEATNGLRMQIRTNRIRRNRDFLAAQLATIRLELREAEEELEGFQERNVRTDSPELTFELARLQRQVELREGLLRTLTELFEAARTADRVDARLITVIDPALPPVKRAWPRRREVLLMTGLGSLAVGALLALTLEYMRQAQYLDELRGCAVLVRDSLLQDLRTLGRLAGVVQREQRQGV